MGTVVTWWLIVELLGLIGWAAGWRAFARFPDRGFAWSKPLGVLLVGGALWLLVALGVLRNDLGGAWIATLLVAAVAGRRALRAPATILPALAALWRRRRRLILLEEAIFALALLAWTTVRAADPAVAHTEQPMDLMFVAAVSASAAVPPGDLWLAGEPISYYYLGYWLLATIGLLAGQLPEFTYNLGQATWWAFLLSGAFGLGFHLTRPGSNRRSAGRALVGGLLAAFGVALAGNLHRVLELARAGLSGLGDFARSGGGLWDDWWWWRASRAVADADYAGRPVEVITEFPFFSYLLGDDHPHLLSMPFLVLAAALALAVARAAPSRSTRGPGSGWLAGQNRAALVLGSIVVAALVPLNTWDFPAGALLLVAGAFAARPAGQPSPLRVLMALMALMAGGLALAAWSAILTLPYLLTAQSQVRGIRPNLLNPTSATELAVMFGAFLPGVLLVLGERRPRWRRIALVALGLAAAAATILALGALWGTQSESGRAWIAELGGADPVLSAAGARWVRSGAALLVVLGLLAATLCALADFARTPRQTSAGLWATILLALGLGLLATAELVYLQDLFGTRMNTVFKFWYQAWLFLALASAVGLTRTTSRAGTRALRFAGFVLAGGALLYPATALPAKISNPRWTLDALSGLEELSPGLVAAGRWLRASTPAGTRILEAPGESYRADQSLVSAISGRATLVGWQGHEQQWRGGDYERLATPRLEAAARIYGAATSLELGAELERWRIDYVLCGPRERERYGADDPGLERRLRDFMVPVFESGDVTLLRRR